MALSLVAAASLASAGCRDGTPTAERATWTVDAVPLLDISDDDAGGEVVLGEAVHVARHSEGGVIVTDRGKANVDNGVMYLDIADDYAVFVHELAHFAGFVDEYPMSAQQANIVCRSVKAPNLVVEGELTYQPISRIQEWRTLDQSLSLSVSRTCEKVGVTAYKPSTAMTFLEHHDIGHIPPIYLALWRSQIESKGLPTLRDHFMRQ
jgi:hypothetical protein